MYESGLAIVMLFDSNYCSASDAKIDIPAEVSGDPAYRTSPTGGSLYLFVNFTKKVY